MERYSRSLRWGFSLLFIFCSLKPLPNIKLIKKSYRPIIKKTTTLEALQQNNDKENLYKVGGSFKRLKKAEVLLWQGQVQATQALFTNCKGKQARISVLIYSAIAKELLITAIAKLNKSVL